MHFNSSTIIDISQPISTEMPHWPGDPPTSIEPSTTVARDGYALNRVTIGEHSGTHIGAPSHFNESGWSIDHIPASNLVAPAVIINIEKQCINNPNFLLTPSDITRWEKAFGSINLKSVVLVKTGWGRYWSSDTYLGKDEYGLHFPGISFEAVEFLIRQRHIFGLGIDTAGIDGGQSTTFSANIKLAENNLFHLENLNLQSVTTNRLLIFIGALKIQNGSGSPCRIIALENSKVLE